MSAAHPSHATASQLAAAIEASPSVRMYCARTSDVTERDIATLPRPDLERLSADARPLRRQQHLAGRVLLRAALARSADGRAHEKDAREITLTPHGKPECAGGPSISVSHSGAWTACALATPCVVGVDVEQPRPGRQLEAIARAHFSPAEAEWLAAQPDPRFYMLWVLKEAYLKAVGVGLAGGLGALQLRIEGSAIEIVGVQPALRPSALQLYALDDAFVGIATLGGAGADVMIERWNPNGAPRWLPHPLELLAATPL